MKGTRVMVTRYGFVEVPNTEGKSDSDILQEVKTNCSESDIDWGSIDWDGAEVVGDVDMDPDSDMA